MNESSPLLSPRVLSPRMYESSTQSNWIDIQHVTFTSWVNLHLKKIGIILSDLPSGFTDGTNLIHLIDQLTLKHQRSNDGQTPPLLSPRMNSKPKIPVQMMENINWALQRLRNENINLTGITSNEINKGNLKICLALVWRLILFYQFKSKKGGDENDVMESPSKSRGLSVEKEMIGWIRNVISEYTEKYGFNVNDISSSWADGKALGAVIDRLLREKFNGDVEAFKEFFNYERDVINTDKSHAEINSQLVDVANDYLDIPELIHSNILEKGPEKLSMLTYLSYFREKGEELLTTEPQHDISSPTTSTASDLIALESPQELEDQQSLLSSIVHDPSLCPNCGTIDILRTEIEQHIVEKDKLKDLVEKLEREMEMLNSKLEPEKAQPSTHMENLALLSKNSTIGSENNSLILEQELISLKEQLANAQNEKENLSHEMDHIKSELLLLKNHEQKLLEKIGILEQISQHHDQTQLVLSNLREQNKDLMQQAEDLNVCVQEQSKALTSKLDETHESPIFAQSTSTEPNNQLQLLEYMKKYEAEKMIHQELQHKNTTLEQQLTELKEKLTGLENNLSSHQSLAEKLKILHEQSLQQNDILRKQLDLQREDTNTTKVEQQTSFAANESSNGYLSSFNVMFVAAVAISVTFLMSRKK